MWKFGKLSWIHGVVIDCIVSAEFDGFLKHFQSICSPWSLFVEYATTDESFHTRKSLQRHGQIR